MTVLLLAIPVVLYALGASTAAVVVAAVAALVLLAATRSYRRTRRERQARHRAERARWIAAERAERTAREKAQRHANRRNRIRSRTGLDIDVVERLVRDLAGRGQAAVRATGERVNDTLEKRYPTPPPPAPAAEIAAGTWLDLDTDFEAMQSRARTAEMLRLASLLNPSKARARSRA